jgi:hypothetical protein
MSGECDGEGATRVPDTKKLVAAALKNLRIIQAKETGQIIVHLNEGGVTKIIKMVEVKE